MRSTVWGRAAGVVVAVLASVAVAACGGSTKSSSTPSAGTQTSTQSSTGTVTSTGTGTSTSSSQTSTAASLWSLPNADANGTRNIASQINSSNVSQLKVAWTIPIKGVPSGLPTPYQPTLGLTAATHASTTCPSGVKGPCSTADLAGPNPPTQWPAAGAHTPTPAALTSAAE